MQVEEVSADGLKRAYRVVIPAVEIEDRVQTRLKRLSQTVRMPGFRPGKAPISLLRKQYGRSVMGEILEQAVDEGSRKAIEDNQLRPALRPKIEVTSFDEGQDLEFAVNLEVLPDVPKVELGEIALERPVVEVDEAKVDEAIERLAASRQQFAPPAEPRPSADGDRITIDFQGTIDGRPFEGGKGENMTLLLGSGSMVPGFEEQLVGVSPGEAKAVVVTFPEDFPREELKGKEARFEVQVKDVQAPQPVVIDDEWAKSMGAEDLTALRRNVRERIESEYKSLARQRTKRELLDKLAEAHKFEVPPGMVDLEFDAIWRQLTDEMQRNGQTFESEGESEEDARGEYRAIAERRVRLGLILSDIGTANDIKVENQELQQALMREAMRFPGQERQVFEFYRNNPAAMENLRAPLFEDKVVDFIIQLARIEDVPMGIDQLLAEPEDQDEKPVAAEAG